MKFKNILKKDIFLVLGITLLILLLTIGVVCAKAVNTQKSNKIILEKAVITTSETKSEEPMIVEIGKSKMNEEYYIKVNYQANTVTVYRKNEDGEYTIPEKAFVCSCGEDTPTSGVYTISDKYEWRALVGDVYGQYATRIVGSILFHSVPYKKQDKSSLEYEEYDKLGQTASAGCVRLKVADAKWIYDYCKEGTKVEFYASEDPGPLRKKQNGTNIG